MATSITKATPAVPAEDNTDSKVSDDTKADAVVSDNKGVAWGVSDLHNECSFLQYFIHQREQGQKLAIVTLKS